MLGAHKGRCRITLSLVPLAQYDLRVSTEFRIGSENLRETGLTATVGWSKRPLIDIFLGYVGEYRLDARRLDYGVRKQLTDLPGDT